MIKLLLIFAMSIIITSCNSNDEVFSESVATIKITKNEKFINMRKYDGYTWILTQDTINHKYWYRGYRHMGISTIEVIY